MTQIADITDSVDIIDIEDFKSNIKIIKRKV